MRMELRMQINTPTDHMGGFALVTVLWLALISFLVSTTLWTYLASARNVQMAREASFRRRLAIDEVIQVALRTPDLFPFDRTGPRMLMYRSVTNRHSYKATARSWGLWALLDIHEAGQKERLLARRLVTGTRRVPAGVVLEVKENRLPLVLADAADVRGIVVVADSVVTHSWKGRTYLGAVPSWNSGARPLPRVDWWEAAHEWMRALSQGTAPAPTGTALLAGPLLLEPNMVRGLNLVFVDGDVRLQGRWPSASVCISATGSILVLPGTEFTGQLLAEESITVRSARIRWPSLIAAATPRGKNSMPSILLLEGSRVMGTICVGMHRDLFQAQLGETPASLHVDESSELAGHAVVYGSLQMNGTMVALAQVAETRERRDPATYHNWILGGRWRPLRDELIRPLLPLLLGLDSFEAHAVEVLP